MNFEIWKMQGFNMAEKLVVRGAREHNLRNIDLDLDRNPFDPDLIKQVFGVRRCDAQRHQGGEQRQQRQERLHERSQWRERDPSRPRCGAPTGRTGTTNGRGR